MSTQIEPALREVAVGQHGLFTTQQAHRAGMTAFALVEAVRGGALLHPGRGLYAVADLVDTARGLTDGRPTEDLVPDEVTVFELEAAENPAATIPWPGPVPDEFLTGRSPVYGVERCGVLRGPAAATPTVPAPSAPPGVQNSAG